MRLFDSHTTMEKLLRIKTVHEDTALENNIKYVYVMWSLAPKGGGSFKQKMKEWIKVPL